MVGRINRGRGKKDDENDPERKAFVHILVAQLRQLMTQPKPEGTDSPVKECPNAPERSKPETSSRRTGLPRPFDPKPRARRCLFPEDPVEQSPLPPIPACPPRKSSRVHQSLIGERRHLFARRRLVFGDDMEQDTEKFTCDDAATSASKEEPSVPTTSSAPASLESDKEINTEHSSDTSADSCDTSADSQDDSADSCETPAYSQDDSEEDQYKSEEAPFDVVHASQWTRFSTPPSAPIPSLLDTPKTSRRTRHRRSGKDTKQSRQ